MFLCENRSLKLIETQWNVNVHWSLNYYFICIKTFQGSCLFFLFFSFWAKHSWVFPLVVSLYANLFYPHPDLSSVWKWSAWKWLWKCQCQLFVCRGFHLVLLASVFNFFTYHSNYSWRSMTFHIQSSIFWQCLIPPPSRKTSFISNIFARMSACTQYVVTFPRTVWLTGQGGRLTLNV